MIAALAGASRSAVIFKRLVDHLGREPRQQRRDDADLADAIGRDADAAAAWPQPAPRRAPRAATANGIIFTVAIISPATDRLVGRQRRHGDRFVDAIEAVDGRPCRPPARPAPCANRLARPVKARSTCTPSPATAAAISAAATSSETSPASSRATTMSLMPAASQRRGLGRADQRALLEHQRALSDGVHGGGADRVFRARPLRTS